MLREPKKVQERTASQVAGEQAKKPANRFRIEKLEERIAPTHMGPARACDITGGRVCENL